MSSDLQATGEKKEELEPKKAAGQILKHEIQEGRTAIEQPAMGLFISGLSAGLDIGFSLLLMAVTKTQVEGYLSHPIGELLVANMLAVGFIFVVVGRSELFTEQTTLGVLPVLNRKASLSGLARTWGIVYIANLIGATIFAAIAILIGPALDVVKPHIFGEIASTLTNHGGGGVILVSAILAGWLMGLLSWLVAASRDTISQIVLTWLIATVIGYVHLHHVVVGTAEVLVGVFAGQGTTYSDYGRFLFWTTLGNAIGGPLFVAIIKYSYGIGGNEEFQR